MSLFFQVSLCKQLDLEDIHSFLIPLHVILSGGNTGINFIPITQFTSIASSPLEELRMVGLGIGSIENGTLKNLTSLKILDLSNNPRLGWRIVGPLYDLHYTSIEKLYLNNTGIAESIENLLSGAGICRMLRSKLKVLTLDQNDIGIIEERLEHCIPGIEYLSLRGNSLYESSAFVMDIYRQTGLIGLDLSHQTKYMRRGQKQKHHHHPTKSAMARDSRGLGHPFCKEGQICPVWTGNPRGFKWVDMSQHGKVSPTYLGSGQAHCSSHFKSLLRSSCIDSQPR